MYPLTGFAPGAMASHSEARREEEKKRLQVTFNLSENCMNRLISERSEHYPSVGAVSMLNSGMSNRG